MGTDGLGDDAAVAGSADDRDLERFLELGGPTLVCPACNGSGQVHVFAFMTFDKQYPEGGNLAIPCLVCDGKGRAYESDIRRLRKGRQMRAARLARDEGLSEAARRLNMPVGRLIAVEQGWRPGNARGGIKW